MTNQGPENPRQSNTMGSDGPYFAKPIALPQEQGIEPKVLALVDYNLISVAAEAERREALLKTVVVDENGVAHCTNSKSGIETAVVAVRIDDKKKASKIPLVRQNDFLKLVLPPEKPSRIGFFVGYKAQGRSITGVLRTGLYPGVPLTTQTVNDRKNQEIMYGLRGIKPTENEQKEWAEQIKLSSDLGFNLGMSRGMFNRSHRPNPTTEHWEESPLVVTPERHDDLVRHYNREEVRGDELQILFYGERPVSQLDPYLELPSRHSDTLFSYGGDNMKGMSPTRRLGLGFGDAVSRQAQTQRTEIDSLQGAFRIVISPQGNHS